MIIDGVEVTVTGGEASAEELTEYVNRGRQKYGHRLNGITADIDGDYVGLRYHVDKKPFERIRRITGGADR